VFGENCDLIYSLVFEPSAQARFKESGDYSFRSIVQLRKKFKKDGDTIDKYIARKKAHEDVDWFEAKYKVDITKFNAQQLSEFTKKGVLFDEEFEESISFSEGPISAGLISATNIRNSDR